MEDIEMEDFKGVLVCGEVAEGKLAPVTLELLGIGRKLADEVARNCPSYCWAALAPIRKDAIAYGRTK